MKVMTVDVCSRSENKIDEPTEKEIENVTGYADGIQSAGDSAAVRMDERRK